VFGRDDVSCCSDNTTMSLDGNVIGRLQEMTQKRRLPPPAYECCYESGPAHSREYCFTVRLLSITEKGMLLWLPTENNMCDTFVCLCRSFW
jgi:hypothetical protein